MDTTGKNKSNPASSLRGDIPAEVMAKLPAAYQAPGCSSSHGCPDPDIIIGYSLEELIPEKRAQVYAHLSECKDCLELVLDLRSAWAEAQGEKYQVRESAPIRVQAQSWLAGLVDGVSGSLSRLIAFPRLVPVAVALVVLAVAGFGVFQHLTAPTSIQHPVTMTNLRPDATYNYRVSAIDIKKWDNVSPCVFTKAKTNLLCVALLLEN
jgi:hypothetical protein